MNEVQIEKIASELGIKSREFISRIGQLSEEIFVNLPDNENNETVDKIVSFFRN